MDAVAGFPDLPPPGLMGKLSEEQMDVLKDAVKREHEQPPNPKGSARDPMTGQWVPSGPWAGPSNVPGPFRRKALRTRVARTYLEEAILQ